MQNNELAHAEREQLIRQSFARAADANCGHNGEWERSIAPSSANSGKRRIEFIRCAQCRYLEAWPL